jgi:hypothetical protein
MPGILKALCVISQWFLKAAYEVVITINPHFTYRETKVQAATEFLDQGYTVKNWQSKVLNPDDLAPEHLFFAN